MSEICQMLSVRNFREEKKKINVTYHSPDDWPLINKFFFFYFKHSDFILAKKNPPKNANN